VIEVKNGNRVLQFEGDLIGRSSSRRNDSIRWVEFKLYRTRGEGRYVLTRVGMSLLYHLPSCSVVKRNNLHEAPRARLDHAAVECDECRPDEINLPIVCPERPRYWAQVCDTPAAVIDALTKSDDSGNRYLTFVAQRLLEQAAEVDSDIYSTYSVETVL